MKFLGRWPRAGMMQNGRSYGHVISGYLTEESGCILLPTARASDGLRCSMGWAKKPNKDAILKVLSRFGDMSLPYVYVLQDIPIQDWPDLTEKIMGYPTGWTDLEHSETP